MTNLTLPNGRIDHMADDELAKIMPTWDLIDDLLSDRPLVCEKAKWELLARLESTSKEHIIELVAIEAAFNGTPVPQVTNWHGAHLQDNAA
jgi:hypothetical protein